MRSSSRRLTVLLAACALFCSGCGGGAPSESVALEKVQSKFDRARKEAARAQLAGKGGRSGTPGTGPFAKKNMGR